MRTYVPNGFHQMGSNSIENDNLSRNIGRRLANNKPLKEWRTSVCHCYLLSSLVIRRLTHYTMLGLRTTHRLLSNIRFSMSSEVNAYAPRNGLKLISKAIAYAPRTAGTHFSDSGTSEDVEKRVRLRSPCVVAGCPSLSSYVNDQDGMTFL